MSERTLRTAHAARAQQIADCWAVISPSGLFKGSFKDGVGTFYADDTLRGKPIRVRFTWSHITSTSAHWEQAFSPDGGKTWETNWISDFRRAP